jgi:membrane protease subunit HflC
MRRILLFVLLLGAGFAGLFMAGARGYGPIVITREGEKKLLLLFGDPGDAPTRPGWSLRIPLLHDVLVFDARWLHLGIEPGEIQTRDRERIVVDNYVIWRIEDPLLYYKSFPTGQSEAETQIGKQVRAKVREVIGQHALADVVKGARGTIMEDITAKSREALTRVGIGVADVRINRTELPEGTEENVFARMRAERERLARKHRAEGEEEARGIRARADAEALVTVAEAQGEAEIERGRGDAEAARIYAEAYSRNAEFYGFVRGLEAWRKTLGQHTTLVLPPDHEFFGMLESGAGRLPGPRPAPAAPAEAPAAPEASAD